MKHKTFLAKEKTLPFLQNKSQEILETLRKTNQLVDSHLFSLEKENYHFITRFFKGDSVLEKMFLKWLFRTAKKTEEFAANSSWFTTIFSFILVDEWVKYSKELWTTSSEEELLSTFKEAIAEIRTLLEGSSTPFSKKQLEELAFFLLKEKDLVDAALEAVNLAGLQGFISIEDSQANCYSVEMRSGYSFSGNVSRAFMTDGKWSYSNVKVLVVDGIIEQVSELDKILKKSNETMTPLLLCAQGFGEEVLATLKVNFDKNKLNIQPVKFPPEVETLNVLNDIAVVSGGDLVSTLKGELLVFVDYDKIPVVEHVVCNEKGVLIRNSSTTAAVNAQVKNLIEKKQEKLERELFDVTGFYDNRIKSLISSNVILRLPRMSRLESESKKTKLDIFLRSIKTSLSHGVVDLEKLKKELPILKNNLWNKGFVRCLSEKTEKTTVPLLTLYLSLYFAGLGVVQILASSGVVVEDSIAG